MYEKYPQFSYDRVDHQGMLIEPFRFKTRVTGHNVYLTAAELRADGTLFCYVGCRWDFGTGAVDTVAMIISSLQHDVMCRMINDGHLPKSLQSEVDKDFRKALRYWTVGQTLEYYWSGARYRAVRTYSKIKEWWS